MRLLTRACPACFRLGALFEALDISTSSEPTLPSGIVSFGPSGSGLCQPFKLQGARLLHDQKAGAYARPVMVTIQHFRYERPEQLGSGCGLHARHFAQNDCASLIGVSHIAYGSSPTRNESTDHCSIA
jgi:hypothetical protein